MRWAAAWVVVAVVLLVAAPSAVAEKKYRVEIVTEPEGVEIRIDDPDSDPIGTSPWTGSLAAGPYMLILDLESHEQLIEEIVVKKKRRKRQTFSFTLQEIARGTLTVNGEGPASGASISVDGDEVGTVPDSIEVNEGTHELVVSKSGFEPFEKWVEVSGGETSEVSVELEPIGGKEVVQEVKRVAPPARSRTAPVLLAAAGLQLAWRRWDYLNPRSPSARGYAADWVPVFRASVEAYPLATLDSEFAHGFGVRGSVGLGLPPAVDAGAAGQIETSWSELELGALYRVPVSDSVGLQAELGWTRTRYAFTDAGASVDEVPDVDYRNLRIGARIDYARDLGGRELRTVLGASVLDVMKAGAVAQRFSSATAAGIGLEAGSWYQLAAKLRVGASLDYRRYVFEFVSAAGDPVEADGSTDIYVGLSLGAVYVY